MRDVVSAIHPPLRKRRGRPAAVRNRHAWAAAGIVVGSSLLAVAAAARPPAGDLDTVPLLTEAVRITGYAGITIFAGLQVFWTFVWPGGRRDRLLIAVAWTGLVALAVSAFGGLAWIVGSGADPDLLARPGAPFAARLVLCAVAVPWLARYARGHAAPGPGAALAVALALTVATGHPGDLPAGTAALTELHVVAAAGWLGSLLALAIAVIPRPRPSLLHRIVVRYSTVSSVCIITVALTGTIQAVVRAGSPGQLAGSGYGDVLLVKLLAVGGMLLARTGNHAFVRRLSGRPLRVQVLALCVGAELALGATVLHLTATLTSSR